MPRTERRGGGEGDGAPQEKNRKQYLVLDKARQSYTQKRARVVKQTPIVKQGEKKVHGSTQRIYFHPGVLASHSRHDQTLENQNTYLAYIIMRFFRSWKSSTTIAPDKLVSGFAGVRLSGGLQDQNVISYQLLHNAFVHRFNTWCNINNRAVVVPR